MSSRWKYTRTQHVVIGLMVFALFLYTSDPLDAFNGRERQLESRYYEDIWPDLKQDIFGDRPILDGRNIIKLKAPSRAQDAAIVPVTIAAKFPQSEARFIKAITLVVDKNPAPVAAEFGLVSGTGLATLSTRLRVNNFSYVRAIAETNDGKLYMVQSFVKASGGCSAPMGKDPAEAIASMGQMKLRQYPMSKNAHNAQIIREAQLMIRHPNASGLQIDVETRGFVPAHFVRHLEVKRGDDIILTMEGRNIHQRRSDIPFSLHRERRRASFRTRRGHGRKGF